MNKVVVALEAPPLAQRTFRGFFLDKFQEEAFRAIDEDKSVLVAAPTGTGKTLVADYLIEKALGQGQRAIYTAPIKALSNQKFREFSRRFGKERIGIITGDVVQNGEAEILIMTTEILRNMSIMRDEALADVASVIFDEIHFIDSDRGAAWEESLIFIPKGIRILGLSATIPNVDELADWLSQVRGERPVVIREERRAVPLRQLFFNRKTGLTDLLVLRKQAGELLPSSHLDLVQTIRKEYLPCLYFVFSRRMCEEKAAELGVGANFLTLGERKRVSEVLARQGELSESRSFRFLSRLLLKGIGVHHAGLLPRVKDLVEELYEDNLIKILYCTETFSVGLNFPVKAVLFDSLRKFDGRDFRSLKVHEFSQMSGRAGRRGMDRMGYAIVLADPKYLVELVDYRERRPEALRSQFTLSYNTVLNLIRAHAPKDIPLILAGSFATYLRGKEYGEKSDLLHQAEIEIRRLEELRPSCRKETDCPLAMAEARRDLSAAETAWRVMGARKKRGKKGKTLQREMGALQRALAVQPRSCTVQGDDSGGQIFGRFGAVQPDGHGGNPMVGACRGMDLAMVRLGSRVTEYRHQLGNLPAESHFLEEFQRKRAVLEEMGYLTGDSLLPRGVAAGSVHIQEILVTELLFQGFFHRLDEDHINALAVAVDFEPRRGAVVRATPLPELKEAGRVARELKGVEGVVFNPLLSPLAYRWSQGADFREITRLTSVDEGDVVSTFRRAIDLLRQLGKAVEDDPYLVDKLLRSRRRMDRGVVQVEL